MSLLTNLISYWKLDEASGNALDAHGSNDLTDTNTVGSATGKISNARDFENGSNQYFTHADSSDLSTGDIDFSFSFWMNPESFPSFESVFTKDDFSGNREYGSYYDTSANRLKFYVFGFVGGGFFVEVACNNFGAMSAGTWYHVVCWHDSVNDQIGIAINAGTADTASCPNGCIDGTAPFRIGQLGGGATNSFDGLIDEFGFWKRVLTSQERTDLYNGGAGLAYPLTVGGGGATFQYFMDVEG